MRRILKIASVLTWINMIFWGLLCTFVLLGLLTSGMLTYLVVLVLPSAIVLHSYAALQLHKSLRDPKVPLSRQTPTGIRFIGFVALFLGISYVVSGFTIIQNAREYLQQLQAQITPEMKDIHFTEVHIRWVGIVVLVIGLCVVVNANLNFRLLRWYQSQSRDNKERP